MILLRTLKWLASAVLALVIVAVLFVALFGWDWLRAPLERPRPFPTPPPPTAPARPGWAKRGFFLTPK